MRIIDNSGARFVGVGRAIPARYTADQAVYADMFLDLGPAYNYISGS